MSYLLLGKCGSEVWEVGVYETLTEAKKMQKTNQKKANAYRKRKKWNVENTTDPNMVISESEQTVYYIEEL